jgi:hypothetical protein
MMTLTLLSSPGRGASSKAESDVCVLCVCMCTSPSPSALSPDPDRIIIALRIVGPGWDSGSFDRMMGRLECGTSAAWPFRRRFVWSPSSSIERVTTTVVVVVVEARIRPLPFSEDPCATWSSPSPSLARARAAFIRFREFSSTRADARPSMSRNLDASAAGIARTSSWERLC